MTHFRSLAKLATLVPLAVGALALGACSQNDSTITRHVESRLAHDGVTDQVHVSTERRIVHLEGVVADRAELNRAEMAARNEPGILGVDNRLVVQHPVDLTSAPVTPALAPPAAGPTPPLPPPVPTNAAP